MIARDGGRWASPRVVLTIALVVVALIIVASRVVPGRSPAGRDFAVPWELTEVTEDGVLLAIRALHAPCEELGEASVAESEVAVVVTIRGFRPLRDCSTEVKYSRYEVRLDAPIGSRRLVGCELDGDCRTVAS